MMPHFAPVPYDLPLLQRRTFVPMQWAVLLLAVSVTFSVALDNLLLLLLLFGMLFSLGSVSHLAWHHPVARAGLLLFGVLGLATLVGDTPWPHAMGEWFKYIDLLFVPVLLLLCGGDLMRRRVRFAFIAAMGVTLCLSLLVGTGILPVAPWMDILSAPDNPVIFRSHITQNNMMALAAFLALLEARAAATPGARMMWGAFAALATFNVLFMVQGRTGYAILLVLLGWFAWTTLRRYLARRGHVLRWQRVVLLALAFVALLLAAYQASPRLHERVGKVLSGMQHWSPNQGKDTSTGQRLDFYYNTVQIIRTHPLSGVGTGGFGAAFAVQTAGTEVVQTQNPHNEFLMVTAQSGIAGLFALLFLLYTLWRYAPGLPTALEQDAARGLVLAYAVNGLFNSALHDHADGLLFALLAAALFAGLERRA